LKLEQSDILVVVGDKKHLTEFSILT
jgi:hypothetical protein